MVIRNFKVVAVISGGEVVGGTGGGGAGDPN